MNSPLNNRLLEVEQNTSPAVLILLDANGNPVAFNRAARQLLSVVDGIPWLDVLHPSEAELWRNQIQISLQQQLPISGWFRLRRFDNAFRQFVLRAEPRYDHNGDFFGHHVSGLDVTGIAGDVQTLDAGQTATQVPEAGRGQADRRSVAKEWHDTLVNEATVIGVSTDVLLELIKARPDNHEILDIAERVRRSAASICEQLKILNRVSREA